MCVCVDLQKAFNAATAISHMKKLQLAHDEPPLCPMGAVPDIEVEDVSYPMPPNSHLEGSKGLCPLKPSFTEPNHALVVTETGKHAYHSEPDLPCTKM